VQIKSQIKFHKMEYGKEKIMKESLDNKIFIAFATMIVCILALLCLLPFINLLALSLSSSEYVMKGEITFWPKGFTTVAYKAIVENGVLTRAMIRTILLTIVYIGVAMVMSILCAYPMSHKDLKGRKFLWVFIIFTMYFSGGMIPTYLAINQLGLIDSMAALVLPAAISTYNMILMKTFFASIPESLKESAIIDGANDAHILWKIVLPLSKPMLATITLFYAVSRWNAVTDALLYINTSEKYVLQVRLRQMIQNYSAITDVLEGSAATDTMVALTVRSASLIFSLIPILLIYPFVQKYFVKGVMIGSVKG